jgi:hypothetical protein
MFRKQNNEEISDNDSQTRVIYEQTNEEYEAFLKQKKPEEKTTLIFNSLLKKEKERILINPNSNFQDQTRIIYRQPDPAWEREETESLIKKIKTHAIQRKERQQQAQLRQLALEQETDQRLLDIIHQHELKQQNTMDGPLQSLELLPEQEEQLKELIVAKIKEKEALKEQKKKEREYQRSQREHHTQQAIFDVLHKHQLKPIKISEPAASHVSLNQKDNNLQNFYKGNQSPLFSHVGYKNITQDKEPMQSVEDQSTYKGTGQNRP